MFGTRCPRAGLAALQMPHMPAHRNCLMAQHQHISRLPAVPAAGGQQRQCLPCSRRCDTRINTWWLKEPYSSVTVVINTDGPYLHFAESKAWISKGTFISPGFISRIKQRLGMSSRRQEWTLSFSQQTGTTYLNQRSPHTFYFIFLLNHKIPQHHLIRWRPPKRQIWSQVSYPG